jgi:hypothetical protein
MAAMGSFVPENVKNFILYFRRHVNEANVPGILSMYETMWPYDTPRPLPPPPLRDASSAALSPSPPPGPLCPPCAPPLCAPPVRWSRGLCALRRPLTAV